MALAKTTTKSQEGISRFSSDPILRSLEICAVKQIRLLVLQALSALALPVSKDTLVNISCVLSVSLFLYSLHSSVNSLISWHPPLMLAPQTCATMPGYLLFLTICAFPKINVLPLSSFSGRMG